MLASAQNFALGFFGWPLEGKYHELVTIESPGVRPLPSTPSSPLVSLPGVLRKLLVLPSVDADDMRSSITPSLHTKRTSSPLLPPLTNETPRCPNARDPAKGDRGLAYLKEWAGVYLEDARGRLNAFISGYEFSVEDVYCMQQVRSFVLPLFVLSSIFYLPSFRPSIRARARAPFGRLAPSSPLSLY